MRQIGQGLIVPTRQRFKNLAAKFVDSTFLDFTEGFTIEQVTQTTDSRGGYTEAWATFATVDRGFVTPEKASESVKDERLNSNHSYIFSFQHIDGLSDKMRINYGGVKFNIRSIESIKDQDVWVNIHADRDVAT